MTKTIAQLIEDYSQGITTRRNEKQARRDKFANLVTTILSDILGDVLQKGESRLFLRQDTTQNIYHQRDYNLKALYNEACNQDNATLVAFDKKETIFDVTDLFISLGYIYVHRAYLSKTQVKRKLIRYELEMTIAYQD